MCSTTSATTVALATVGEPTVTLPSLLTSSTRSKVTGLPGFDGQAFNFQRIARADAILFASCF